MRYINLRLLTYLLTFPGPSRTFSGVFSMTYQDLVLRVEVLIEVLAFFTTFAAHCHGTRYKLLCCLASNLHLFFSLKLESISSRQKFTNSTKYRM